MPTPKVNSWLGWRIFTVNTLRLRPRRQEEAWKWTGSRTQAKLTPMTQSSEEFETLRWTFLGVYLCIVGGICLLLAIHVHIHRSLPHERRWGSKERTLHPCSIGFPDIGTCKQSFTKLILVTVLMSSSHYLPWTSFVVHVRIVSFLGEILNMY
jgi:hypothetical protein